MNTNNISIRERLEDRHVVASAPCRIDMGGTLDLSTFYLPLRSHKPCTFNMALALRTTVTIKSGSKGLTRIQSKGFEPATFSLSEAPFDHPLGLMFAIAKFYEAQGVDIEIWSTSPPRSAMGGSSSAAVALVSAFEAITGEDKSLRFSVDKVVRIAHALEGSVAGVPCGLQDHLAAAYGGIHVWQWAQGFDAAEFKKMRLLSSNCYGDVETHILVAYCGIPHASKDINGQWVRQFLSGDHRDNWEKICRVTRNFIHAISELNYREAAACMNQEVVLRREMTPDVFDDLGEQLRLAAQDNSCGVRFTGAGGGGCIWAMGELEDIDRLRGIWENILRQREDACLLDAHIDDQGVIVNVS